MKHWGSICHLNRRALLDAAIIDISTILSRPSTVIWSEIMQGGQLAIQTVLDNLKQSSEARKRHSLSLPALKMIFGREPASGLRKFDTVRGRGNQAAHDFDHHIAVMSVTQADLKPAERAVLEEIFRFVVGCEPAFEDLL